MNSNKVTAVNNENNMNGPRFILFLVFLSCLPALFMGYLNTMNEAESLAINDIGTTLLACFYPATLGSLYLAYAIRFINPPADMEETIVRLQGLKLAEYIVGICFPMAVSYLIAETLNFGAMEATISMGVTFLFFYFARPSSVFFSKLYQRLSLPRELAE